jgi:hypothetical protein
LDGAVEGKASVDALEALNLEVITLDASVKEINDTLSTKVTREVVTEMINTALNEAGAAIAAPAVPAEEGTRSVLPECEVRMVTYDDDEDATMKIGPKVNKIELDNGTIEVDKALGIVCNDKSIANTIEDHEFLAIVDTKSAVHGDDLVGRYAEFVKLEDERMHVVCGREINAKVIGIITRVIPKNINVAVHRHRLISLNPEVEYCVITRSGIAPVRIPDGSSVRIGDVLVPSVEGLYGNSITAERRAFMINNCIPRAKVLGALQDNLISALII